MQKEQKTALVWFRNDLRVADNLSLHKARSANDRIIGLYCFDPRHFEETSYGFRKTEKFRARFLLESVIDLQQSLGDLNISLIVHFEKPELVIPKLVVQHNIEKIYCQKEWTKEEVDVLNLTVHALGDQVEFVETFDQFLYHPEDLSISLDAIPKVFTTFRKSCENRVEIRSSLTIPPACQPENLIPDSGNIPSLATLGFKTFETDHRSAFPFKGGEKEGHQRIEDYFFTTKRLGYYKKTRNGLVGTDYSSKFSAWLAHGCLSARQIYWAVKRFEKEFYKNQSTYWLVFELIWRDFFKYISLKHGNKIFQIGGILNKNYTWDRSEAKLDQWIRGETPEPFVNANMVELMKTGWMSNRGRQNVASYLARNMQIDWRLGAAYFESMLIDYDVHSNYGNWMYVAGVGNDPRNRKFNVRLQAERYDPRSKFQNLWLQKTLF